MIDIHADDYGYTLNTSKEMLKLIAKGSLDSFSIISNTSFFNDSMELLYQAIPKLPFLPLISVHLNLVEGFNLSSDGLNNLTWEQILLRSYSLNNNKFRKDLKNEIKSQLIKTSIVIEKCIQIANDNNVICKQQGLRIDSHTHTHAIPFVFSIIEEIIEEENLKVEYIRNPKEPLIPFLTHINLKFKPINFVKNIILNIFSFQIDRYNIRHRLPLNYMWGLVMSGNMNSKDISILFKTMLKYSKKRQLEILFHPGIALNEEYTKELNREYFINFNSSKYRLIEKEGVISTCNIKNRLV